MSRRAVTLSALVTLSFSLLAASTQAAPPTINPNDPQHFLWNGQQWYPTGYTPGLIAVVGVHSYDVDPTGSYYNTILPDMANSNVKLIRQVFYFGQPGYDAPDNDCSVGGITRVPLTYYQRTGPNSASDNRPRYDLTKVDQNYINHFKNFVAAASAKKVVVIVDILDSWHLNNEVSSNNCKGPRGRRFDAYYGDPVAGVLNNVNGVTAKSEADFHPSVVSSSPSSVYFHQKELVRRLVQEIGSYDNIIWSVANEVEHSFQTDPAGSPDFTPWKNLMVGEIRAAERDFGKPAHLIMQQDLPDHIKAGGNENYLVPIPAGKQLVRDLFRDRQVWNMPLIADNDGSDPLMDSANGKRRKAWASLTSGGHMTWFGHLLPNLAVWNDPTHVNARKYFGYLTKFVDALAIDLDGMARRDDLVSGLVNGVNVGQKGWLYARVGDEYIAYLDATMPPSGCPTSPTDRNTQKLCFPEEDGGMWPGVNTYQITSLPGTFTATWFNPRTGACRRPPITGTGPTAVFTLPVSNTDYALHIKAGTVPPGVSTPIPAPQTVKQGATVELGVCARGVGTTTFAWQFKAPGAGAFVSLTDGGRFSSTTGATLVITGAQTADTGTYRCLVNVGGTPLNSGPASLTVTP
jgi:cellulase (glycosyl hydrolase family 5)